jgi:hypothetical protein
MISIHGIQLEGASEATVARVRQIMEGNHGQKVALLAAQNAGHLAVEVITGTLIPWAPKPRNARQRRAQIEAEAERASFWATRAARFARRAGFGR